MIKTELSLLTHPLTHPLLEVMFPPTARLSLVAKFRLISFIRPDDVSTYSTKVTALTHPTRKSAKLQVSVTGRTMAPTRRKVKYVYEFSKKK